MSGCIFPSAQRMAFSSSKMQNITLRVLRKMRTPELKAQNGVFNYNRPAEGGFRCQQSNRLCVKKTQLSNCFEAASQISLLRHFQFTGKYGLPFRLNKIHCQRAQENRTSLVILCPQLKNKTCLPVCLLLSCFTQTYLTSVVLPTTDRQTECFGH